MLKCPCRFAYVGRTNRALKTCTPEHRSSVRTGDLKSPVARLFVKAKYTVANLRYLGNEHVYYNGFITFKSSSSQAWMKILVFSLTLVLLVVFFIFSPDGDSVFLVFDTFHNIVMQAVSMLLISLELCDFCCCFCCCRYFKLWLFFNDFESL